MAEKVVLGLSALSVPSPRKLAGEVTTEAGDFPNELFEKWISALLFNLLHN